MAYTYTSDFGGGVILAPCLQVLCAEIAQHYPDAVNLGEIGDASHTTEGYGSDHNPFIAHNGKRYVRAVDIGGPESIQDALFAFVQGLYTRRDPRVWPYGYVHKDNVITSWFGSGTHTDSGDVGHLHISVTQANGYHPSPTGWVHALDSRDPWGLIATTPPTKPKDWFSMASLADLQKAVATAPITNPDSKKTGSLGARIVDIEAQQDRQQAQLDELVANVRTLISKTTP